MERLARDGGQVQILDARAAYDVPGRMPEEQDQRLDDAQAPQAAPRVLVATEVAERARGLRDSFVVCVDRDGEERHADRVQVGEEAPGAALQRVITEVRDARHHVQCELFAIAPQRRVKRFW